MFSPCFAQMSPFFFPHAMCFPSPPKRHDLQQGRSRTPEKFRQQGSPLLQKMLQLCLSSQNLPSGYVKIAIENGPVEIVSFPIKNGVSFHSFLYVYQRVTLFWGVRLSRSTVWWSRDGETLEGKVAGKYWRYLEIKSKPVVSKSFQILIPKFERNSLEWSPPQFFFWRFGTRSQRARICHAMMIG